MAAIPPTVGTVKILVDWKGHTMSPTELAHWKYRVPAITADIAKIGKVLDQTRNLASNTRWSALGRGATTEELRAGMKVRNTWDDEVDALNDELDLARYLLEEAKYKVIYGELVGP